MRIWPPCPAARDPRGAHDVEAEVALLADVRLAGVQRPSARAPRCPSGHSWSRSARCASTAAATASRARGNEKKNASPCVSISVPPRAPNVSRTIRRWSRETLAVRLVAELLQELRRALDVGEDERDGAAGQRAHRRLRYPDEPARAGDEPLPPPARRQPGRLAAVGRGGARRGARTRTSRCSSRSATPPATGAT